MKTIVILAFSVFLFTNCYYDNKEELYPTLLSDCDTVSITWTQTIQPVLATKCLVCHSSSAAPANGAGLVLEGYSNLVPFIVSGQLISVIRHDPGFSPMPKNAGKLDDCTILQIESWINNGYPEN